MTKVIVGGGSSVSLRGTIKPGIEDIIAGDNITIDKTDPKNPIISSSGGGGSMVYPGAGIALSTGSAWGTSITDNSAVWNTAITTATGTQTFTGNKTLNTGGFNFDVSGVADGGMNGSWYFDEWSLFGYNSGSLFRINQGTDTTDGYFELRTNNYFNGFTAGYDGSKRGFGIYTGTAAANKRLWIDEDGTWEIDGGTGNIGDVLTIDGSGLPSWAAPSGGGSSYTFTDGIFDDGGTVGLSGSSPFTQNVNLDIAEFDFGVEGQDGTESGRFNIGYTGFGLEYENTGSALTGVVANSAGLQLYTTNAFQVSADNGVSLMPPASGTGNLRFLELADNGSHYVGFKGADSIAASLLWTLPATDGTANYGLTTNGSGTLNWSNVLIGTGSNTLTGHTNITGSYEWNLGTSGSPVYSNYSAATAYVQQVIKATSDNGTLLNPSGFTISLSNPASTFKFIGPSAPSVGHVWTASNVDGTGYWAAPSGGWALTGTSTLTGAVDIVGSSSNTIKHTFAGLGTTQTDGAGLWLANTTAAAAGAQQISPSLVLEGQGWKTNATAASQSVKYKMDVLPVQGAANPSGTFRLGYSINGAAYTSALEVGNNGNLTIKNGLYIEGSNFISFNSAGSLYAAGNSALSFRSNNSTTAISGGAYRFWNISTYSATSGNQIVMGLESNFAPTSGTANFNAYLGSGTINQTGGANGIVTMMNLTPTITAATSVKGFRYAPISGSATNELSFEATQGNILVPASSYHNYGTTVGSAGYGFRDNLGAIEFKDSGGSWEPIRPTPAIIATTTGVGTETVIANHGVLSSAGTSSSSIHVNAYYSNKTTLVAQITVVAVKTDGSASAHATVTARYRKDNSGTFNLDVAGTVTTSNAAIIADVVGEINGTNPSIKVTMGASSGDYEVSHSAITTWVTN